MKWWIELPSRYPMLVEATHTQWRCAQANPHTTLIKKNENWPVHHSGFTFNELQNSYATNLTFPVFSLGKKEGKESWTTWEEGVFDISLNFLANPKSHSCQETNSTSKSYNWSKELIIMWKNHNIKITIPLWFHFHPIGCLMALSRNKLFPLNVSIWYSRHQKGYSCPKQQVLQKKN